MEEGRRVMIERQTSIETEPMTLRFDQIEVAREAALYVMKTMTMEEAMHIFTQGMEAVGGGKRMVEEERYMDWEDEDDEMLITPHHHLLQQAFKDVATAPF